MTILWQDGFDLYAAQTDLTFNYLSPGGYFSTSGGRFSGGAWSTSNFQLGLTYGVSSIAELWSSFALKVTSGTGADNIIMQFASAAGQEVCVSYNTTNGLWKVFRGNTSSGTLLGSATLALTTGWNWVDVHMKSDSSAGIVEVWVNNSQLINLTGQNTVAHTAGAIITVGAGDSFTNTNAAIAVDDWFITDATTGRLGDSRIETLAPSSDAGPNNGTPSTSGSHYLMVNEAQYGTTNYITMPNTSGDKEVYGHTALSSTPATIYAVKVLLVSEKSDAGSFQLAPLVVSSTYESDGSGQQLTTTWGVQQSMFPTDPHTSSAWAYAAVNSASIGYKVP